jgi:PAS domain S-box-containing protein
VQNELTFRQMVDGISALVAVLTPDGAVEFVNRQVLEYFGKTLEELKEWGSTDAVHPDDLPGVIAVWRRSVESGQPYDVELRQRRADSVYRWFHVQSLPVRDAEGRIIRWCVHSWMTGYIGIVSHPYFAVTDAAGAFTIANVPAGKQTMQVWHEQYGALTQTVDVKAGGMTTVEFAYAGNEKPSPSQSALAVQELVVPADAAAVQLMASSR